MVLLGMKACLDKLEELKKEEKKYFIPNQFTNPNNPKSSLWKYSWGNFKRYG